MTTISTLVTDAAFQAGVLGQDQTLSSGDSQLILRVLQRMLDSWSNEKLMIYANDAETFTMTAGTQSYSTSILTNGRPVAITSLRATLGTVDYPIDEIDQLTWNDIAVKSIQSIPRQMYYDTAFPNANMFFFPVPNANYTITMYCQRALSGNTPLTLTTTLSMPLGYEQAIVDGLSVAISPFFGKQATQQMVANMIASRAKLKRVNFTPLEMDTPFDGSGDISNAFPARTF